MIKLNKKTITIGSITAVIIIVALGFLFFGKGSAIHLSSVEVKAGDITEKISLTGQVKSSQGVDLAFDMQGKIVANYVKVGDKIYAGQALVAQDSSTLQAQLAQAQAQLDALNMGTVESKTNASLQSAYANSLAAIQKSVTVAKDILLTVSDIQFNHFTGMTQQTNALFSAKERVVNSLLGQPNGAFWASQSIAGLNGGAFGSVQNAINNPTADNIDSALSASQAALQDVSALIDAVPIDSSLTAAERASLSAAKTSINLEIIATSANIQAIASLKVNNSATITTTNAQIEAAKANVDAIKTQISKTVLRALFNGQVDKDSVVVGQFVSSNSPVITISNNNLEVDTNISEIDLNAAKIGAKASITLDAFGAQTVFPATIVSVDLAPSIVNGVSVYGAKLKFDNADSRITTGMTANITVFSDTDKNVLLVPRSAVIQNSGQYLVLVDKGNSKKETRQVVTGLRDGTNIEIISGLQLGEKVLAY